jgi:hypothetical protein
MSRTPDGPNPPAAVLRLAKELQLSDWTCLGIYSIQNLSCLITKRRFLFRGDRRVSCLSCLCWQDPFIFPGQSQVRFGFFSVPFATRPMGDAEALSWGFAVHPEAVKPQLSVNKKKKPCTIVQPNSHVHHANVLISLLSSVRLRFK